MPTLRRILNYTPAVMMGLVVGVGCLVLLALCFTHRVWSVGGWQVYQAVGRECHPVWRDYHFGRISAGDSVEDVIARSAPGRVERKGRGVILHYSKETETGGGSFTGLTAIAYDGRMVFAAAGSCAWVRLFFDEMTDEQSREFFGRSTDDPRRLGIVPVYR
jgi:hypothetical protein